MSIKDFRNLSEIEMYPYKGVNIIYGDNGQGKTNIIEAIWLCTGAKSFRGSKTKELKGFEKDVCFIENEFDGFGREQKCKIKINTKKYASLNGVMLENAFNLAGRFCAVVFSPCHLSLVTAGAEDRRKFIDSAICQYKPSFIIILAKYKKLIIQKNALIKHYIKTKENPNNELFEVYDRQLAILAMKIYYERDGYIKQITSKAKELYREISSKKETLDIIYKTNYEKTEETFCSQLKQFRLKDFGAGFCTIGPHRDDIEILIGKKSAKAYASQGQIRSSVLVLKLAEGEILKEIIGENPIILLDDVLSELDKKRQDYLLNHIKGQQIFITCCDGSSFTNLENGKQFKVKGGKIVMESFSS